MVVGLIGAGNMAAALARGWAASQSGPDELLLTDSGSGRAKTLATAMDAEAAASNPEAAERAELLVLCVKPPQLEAVAAEVGPALRPGVPVASVLISRTLADLRAAFGPERPVFRVAPNTPVELRQGVILHAADPGAEREVEDRVLELFRLVGTVVSVDEGAFLAAAALVGCGPAFLALVAEAMVDGGVREGLEAELAALLVGETMAGTAALLQERGGDAQAVRREVTSPGGTTSRGLAELEQHGLRAAFQAAVAAATLKGEQP